MKLIFMGTPDFAVGALEAIVAAGHEVAAVVTQPDKPRRGHPCFPAAEIQRGCADSVGDSERGEGDGNYDHADGSGTGYRGHVVEKSSSY